MSQSISHLFYILLEYISFWSDIEVSKGSAIRIEVHKKCVNDCWSEIFEKNWSNEYKYLKILSKI